MRRNAKNISLTATRIKNVEDESMRNNKPKKREWEKPFVKPWDENIDNDDGYIDLL